jgi:dolichyl-phosphate-mannose-protein mannosyltransferase
LRRFSSVSRSLSASCLLTTFGLDSDEPQPLHVVWAWTRGLIPYRDVFDNHMPVFQALSAPLFHLLGVRADIVPPMRLAMIPLFAATIWGVWKISASIFSPRIALWTALLAAFIPPFFLTSVEYRHDDLWTALWLMVLTVSVAGRATLGRAFIAGLFLWPLREPQTRLPFYPVMAIIVSPCLLRFADALLKRTRVFSFILPSLIVTAEIALVARGGSPLENDITGKIDLIGNVLKLTDESDYVMDSKGETIYRHRPIYHMLDRITKRRMHRHLIRDDITERLIETRTALIATASRVPRRVHSENGAIRRRARRVDPLRRGSPRQVHPRL